jgi:hypothetical protein
MFSEASWTGTVGTWNDQSNGEMTFIWQLRRVSDNGVEQSGTGSSPGGSLPVSSAYYLWVRGMNDGGHDPAEDSVSALVNTGPPILLSATTDTEGSSITLTFDKPTVAIDAVGWRLIR